MIAIKYLMVLAGLTVASCSGGSSGGGGTFALIQFLEAGRNDVARNAFLEFTFSRAVAPDQDFAERLRIRNQQLGPKGSDFSRAVGSYVVVGERVTFVPRYPEKKDRSDAGLRPNASYEVYLKGGPDALVSAGGSPIPSQEQFLFETTEYFRDPDPSQPPRALGLLALDASTGERTPLDRLDADPATLADRDSAALIAAGRIIEPGAGGAPDYATPWQFELEVSEPLDPATVTRENVELFEIRSDALAGAGSAPPGHMGSEESWRVPIRVELSQRWEPAQGFAGVIRVTALQTLTDDTRYRLHFKGGIMGIDFRRTFLGDNGLSGPDQPGGTGYTTEFLVYDRPGIDAARTVDYDPLADGVAPEDGTTTLDAARKNTALYNPPSMPGHAVGASPAFGDGRDGDFAVTGGKVVVLDTGDLPNESTGDPFQVEDVDPLDTYANAGSPAAGDRTFTSLQPTEYNFATLTVSSTSTLRITGRNPARIRVKGTVQVMGTIDVRGGDGQNAILSAGTSRGGDAGAGGFAGGDGNSGTKSCSVYGGGSCTSFASYLNACGAAKSGYPFSKKGAGPGRGNQGGEIYEYIYMDSVINDHNHTLGTGGGGGGHATPGLDGEDRNNAGGTEGTPGPSCGHIWHYPNSGVLGARSRGGPSYGDRLVKEVLVGGSGGGAGGAVHSHRFYAGTQASGGGGGGGGGMLEIFAAGSILVSGGVIDVSGGNGGKGAIATAGWSNYRQASGAGGGGSGGSLVLVSAGKINVSGALLDARGGAGGAAASATGLQGKPNAGGDGGKGYLLLMDADGTIDGLVQGTPGDYDDFATGVLSIRAFAADRFGAIVAGTQLFHVGAADPVYRALTAGDIAAAVAAPGQTIHIFMSSAKADPNDPLAPDPATETPLVEVARVAQAAGTGTITLIPDATAALNPAGDASRRPFVRVLATFDYTKGVEAARGPFAAMDRVEVSFRFND